jgi:Sulfatase
VAGWRGTGLAAAELLGLTALAIAQPIFDGLQRSTFAFPPLRIDGWDMVVLAALLVLVPPALLLAVELLAGVLSRAARGWVHLAWIGLLVALLGWQAVALDGGGVALARIAIPAACLIGSVFLYLRFGAARSLCRILGIAAPVIAGLFLFTSPIVNFTFAASPGIPSPSVASETPVVLIVLDEFPLAGLLDSDGKVDAERFPHFAALQRHSDWFRDTLTVADSTEQGVPAILTGDLPDPDGVAIYTDHPRNLFTLLGASYRTNISESGTYLCPPEMCSAAPSLPDRLWPALASGLSTAEDSFPFGLAERAADGLDPLYPLGNAPEEQVKGFVSRIRGLQRGSLNAIHVELPHIPWRYTPSGRAYETGLYPLGLTIERWSRSPGYAIQGLQRMTLQLEYADRVLGAIVRRLRERGIYDSAMIALVADHGAAFIPGQSRRLLGSANAGWILRVPMFVKLPGQRRGRIVSRPVRTIDLLPTIADVLGIRIPWPVDGRSLLGPPSRARLNSYVRHGQEVAHMTPQEVTRSFRTAVAVRNEILGRGDVYTLGASRHRLRRQLHGARPVEFSAESPGGTTFDPEAGTYPSLVYGRILDPGAEDGPLIAELDGRIVAVGQSVGNGTRFTVLIPPEAFHPGRNRLRLLVP